MTAGTLQKALLAPNEALNVTTGLYLITPFQAEAKLHYEAYGDGELYSSVPVSAGTYFLDNSAQLVNRGAGAVRVGYAAIEEEIQE